MSDLAIAKHARGESIESRRVGSKPLCYLLVQTLQCANDTLLQTTRLFSPPTPRYAVFQWPPT